jgi:hypothetical protein
MNIGQFQFQISKINVQFNDKYLSLRRAFKNFIVGIFQNNHCAYRQTEKRIYSIFLIIFLLCETIFLIFLEKVRHLFH